MATKGMRSHTLCICGVPFDRLHTQEQEHCNIKGVLRQKWCTFDMFCIILFCWNAHKLKFPGASRYWYNNCLCSDLVSSAMIFQNPIEKWSYTATPHIRLTKYVTKHIWHFWHHVMYNNSVWVCVVLPLKFILFLFGYRILEKMPSLLYLLATATKCECMRDCFCICLNVCIIFQYHTDFVWK